MASKNARLSFVATALVLAATVAYWYWSPYVAIDAMKSAAKAQDADTFNQYVDYPKLRESLKGQFNTQMADVMGQSDSGDNEFAKAGSAIGAMIGLALVDRMIDAMVRPEMLMKAMGDAKLTSPTKSSEPATTEAEKDELKWVIERNGVSRLFAHGVRAEDKHLDKAQHVRFVLERDGFFHWKLTEVRLPAGGK